MLRPKSLLRSPFKMRGALGADALKPFSRVPESLLQAFHQRVMKSAADDSVRRLLPIFFMYGLRR